MHPEQFQVGVFKTETPARSALARMRVRFAFGQAERLQALGFWRVHRGAHENMVNLEHGDQRSNWFKRLQPF
jgi:hypothetical protein